MNITFPLQYDSRGRTAESTYDEHIRQLIDQVLFTSPGERVNRPDFGCGILALTFEPNSVQLAAALEASILAALQRWLGELISVQNLEVDRDDSKLLISLQYTLLSTGETRQELFERSV